MVPRLPCWRAAPKNLLPQQWRFVNSPLLRRIRASADVATFVCDVTDPEAVTRVHQDVVNTLGDVDILVNNAGQSAAKPFLKITDAEWQADLDLKLMAAIRLTRLVWPGMAQRQWGTRYQSAQRLCQTARCWLRPDLYFPCCGHGPDQGAKR
jgi:NAD(P)-dependent dehydrogenase (short-subunit alcohol dehydrogenase family)